MIEIGYDFDGFTRYQELIKNLTYLESLNEGDYITLSERNIGYVTPFSITPLAALIEEKQLIPKISKKYLYPIRLDSPVDLTYRHDGKKTYFPITRLQFRENSEEEMEKKVSKLADLYINLLNDNIINDPEFLNLVTKDTCSLLISEMTDNIIEHSNANNVYVFCQYWQKNDSCEICLLDDGSTILGSLKNAGRLVSDDYDAIEKVIKEHLSAKNEFGSIKRGTGIKNTINLLINEELKGNFCVISGSASYYIDSEHGNGRLERLHNCNWNGTIINMRFQKPRQKFNIYEYVQF